MKHPLPAPQKKIRLQRTPAINTPCTEPNAIIHRILAARKARQEADLQKQRESIKSNYFTFRDTTRALNRSLEITRTFWITILLVYAYIGITVLQIGHDDLLFRNNIELPLLKSRIDIQAFFILGPLILLLLHTQILIHHAALAKKLQSFSIDAKELLESDAISRRHTEIKLLPYFLAQLKFDHANSCILKYSHHAIGFCSLYAIPIGLLLLFQFKYLPSHD